MPPEPTIVARMLETCTGQRGETAFDWMLETCTGQRGETAFASGVCCRLVPVNAVKRLSILEFAAESVWPFCPTEPQAEIGGRRPRQGLAASSWPASLKSVASSPKRAANWTPTGSPSSFHQSGTDMAG